MLEVDGLSKSYGSVRAVRDVSFTLAAGGSLGVVGESGSGKTTTARIILGLERPDAGSVTVDGHDRSLRLGSVRRPDHSERRPDRSERRPDRSERRPDRSVRRRGRAERLRLARAVQIVFQDPFLSLDPRLSARTVLRETLKLHFPDLDHARRIAELLDQVGLGEREADALPRHLSGGQRQRVAIARALAVEPSVLVLDEAVAALDVCVQAQILNLLADLRERTGTAFLFITHDLGVVSQVTDHLVVMRQGEVVERGTTAEVLADPRHAYTRLLLASVPRPPG
ncbi:ABC transporter ATP-binding protein [Nonomuraea endophytica]|uniref:ABC-type glutathione transport system ATPase component n=1 Tax=Nonomuraea endophytica TaxID=714136 RepID=A0A7W8AD63_9ACTN|nr:ATP-binding cassette domain-containing protein [Nonomuraea endophytica]MBB5084107.1 ABC-type glutathione transport system ATPase component [Nonomuraea endophytica]